MSKSLEEQLKAALKKDSYSNKLARITRQPTPSPAVEAEPQPIKTIQPLALNDSLGLARALGATRLDGKNIR